MTTQLGPSFNASEDIGKDIRVKLDGNAELAIAGAADPCIGQTNRAVLAGENVSVTLANAPGTHEMVASGVIAPGAEVEAAAGGKVATFSAGTKVGVAKHATAADGDSIQVMRTG